MSSGLPHPLFKVWSPAPEGAGVYLHTVNNIGIVVIWAPEWDTTLVSNVDHARRHAYVSTANIVKIPQLRKSSLTTFLRKWYRFRLDLTFGTGIYSLFCHFCRGRGLFGCKNLSMTKSVATCIVICTRIKNACFTDFILLGKGCPISGRDCSDERSHVIRGGWISPGSHSVIACGGTFFKGFCPFLVRKVRYLHLVEAKSIFW